MSDLHRLIQEFLRDDAGTVDHVEPLHRRVERTARRAAGSVLRT